MRTPRTILFFLLCFCFGGWVFSAPKGKTTGVTFDKALPEDISNENFPDRIDSFDFPDASLLDLVKAIGKLTGINFIVDPALQGKKVSIIAPSSITVAEAYKAFLSALSANGYTVVRSGAFWKIQSTDKAHKDNIEVYSGDYYPNTDQLITRIIKLKYIDAKDFSTSIKWLLSQDNKISTHESSNSIILSDYGSVIERIMKIVYEMDIPGSKEGIEIIPIEHASAEELAVILTELLSIEKNTRRSSFISRSGRKSPRVSLSPSAKGKISGGSLKISSIIPDYRTNSLVVSANKAGLKRIRELIQKLDTPIDASRTGGVYVYNVLYGTAEEVYNTLMGIKPSGSSSGRNRINSPFSPRSGSSRVGRFSTRASSSQSPLFENIKIMADSNTNSLIISAKNKYDYERVLAVLKKIDVPRDQVFIQAIIVEMIINQDSNREINLASAVGKIFGESLERNVLFDNVLGSSVAGFLNRSFDVNSLQKATFGPGLILGLPFLKLLENVMGTGRNDLSGLGLPSDIWNRFDDLDESRQADIFKSAFRSNNSSSFNQTLSTAFFPLLRLLKTVTNVNVLSTPQLTTLDNVPAFIEVGENAPVGLTSTAAVGAVVQNSVDRQDITLRLDITPRINPESGTVQMDIKQKFDDFSEENSTASELASRSVRIVKRNIETKMVLHDRETAVLGGLLTDRETVNENKVPLLGDIPIVGWLFKGSDTKKEKRNLLVFITPTIIKGEDQREKTKEILGQKLEERINFIRKYMKGKDPHGESLNELIPNSKAILENKEEKGRKRKWFWQKEELDEKLTVEKWQEPEEGDLDEEPEVLDDEDGLNESVDLTEEQSAGDPSWEDFDEVEPEEGLRPEDYQPAAPEEDSENLTGGDKVEFIEEENKTEEVVGEESSGEGAADGNAVAPEGAEEAFVPIAPEDFGF